MKGKAIFFYGINNLGKSTQADLLVERLKKEGIDAYHWKYPIYDLEPSGPLINQYLREGNPYNLNGREVQLLYSMNRYQYEFVLKTALNEGKFLVIEDYTWTGIAWGMGRGVDEQFLRKINSGLYKEDLCFWFDGERFKSGIERHHAHESDDELTRKVREYHAIFAKENDWIPINANDTIPNIQTKIWDAVSKII